MKDPGCVEFLQWALPRLHLRWEGFRKVHRQVCRRINRRLAELQLPAPRDYQAYLDRHPSEWAILESLCWIPISRFYRDRAVFQALTTEVLPHLAENALARGEPRLTCWSLGCASGEEPYTVAILWRLVIAPRLPHTLTLSILATDIDPQAIERAETGRYGTSSLKDLPADWKDEAFAPTASGLHLKPDFRSPVTFLQQDVRRAMPDGPFDLILCRYLVFTYFDETLQRTLLAEILGRLRAGGALVIGTTDRLPVGIGQLEPWPGCNLIYRKQPHQP